MAVAIDLSGMTFGKLTVTGRAESASNGRAQWLCQCECGRQATYRADNLQRGATRSCGKCGAMHPTGMEASALYFIDVWSGSTFKGMPYSFGEARDAAGELVARTSAPVYRGTEKGEMHACVTALMVRLNAHAGRERTRAIEPGEIIPDAPLIGAQCGRTHRRWINEERVDYRVREIDDDTIRATWYELTGLTNPDTGTTARPAQPECPQLPALTPDQQAALDALLNNPWNPLGN